MDYELSRYIFLKFLKIERYLKSPRTDEEYEKRKKQLKQQIAQAKINYKKQKTEENRKYLKKLYVRRSYNISNSEYLRLLKDIENFKGQFTQIPEDLWCTECFMCITCELKQGKSLQQAIYSAQHIDPIGINS